VGLQRFPKLVSLDSSEISFQPGSVDMGCNGAGIAAGIFGNLVYTVALLITIQPLATFSGGNFANSWQNGTSRILKEVFDLSTEFDTPYYT
jgi:hypothetical protein